MRQQDFEARHGAEWTALERWLTQPARRRPGDDFPARYRRLCHQLALAKQRRYGSQLLAYLNDLVLRSHHVLYSERGPKQARWLRFLRFDFPRTLRANAALVWLATALFALPFLGLWAACQLDPDMIYSVMAPGDVRHMEGLYDPANGKIGRERGSDTDLMMFGFYIKNNIGISFRTFAGGILFGLGSAFFLLYNGVVIGAVAGHLTQLGFGQTFYPFVIGHGAFELTAIVFSGAAGLKLGLSLIDPGPYRRLVALRLAAREAIVIMYGVFLMLVLAAFLEAFWSSAGTVPATVKYTVGGFFWLAVIGYCLLAGRRHGA